MILNISLYESQLETIELLSKELKWKEVSRSWGNNGPLFMGGVQGYPMCNITYEVKTNDKKFKSKIDLTILKSNHVLTYL